MDKFDFSKIEGFYDKKNSKLGLAAIRYKQQRMEFKVLESGIERKKRMINKLCYNE